VNFFSRRLMKSWENKWEKESFLCIEEKAAECTSVKFSQRNKIPAISQGLGNIRTCPILFLLSFHWRMGRCLAKEFISTWTENDIRTPLRKKYRLRDCSAHHCLHEKKWLRLRSTNIIFWARVPLEMDFIKIIFLGSSDTEKIKKNKFDLSR
jgi:hypothetical protein